MRNRQLRAALSAFAEESAWQLASDTAHGADVPFEVVSGGRRDAPLYCYRPLTSDFIAQRVSLLGRLPSYLPAIHALLATGGIDRYLQARGERGYPADGRARAEFTLRVFLTRVFEESTDFVLTPERLVRAWDELERALDGDHGLSIAVVPLAGLRLEADRLDLGEGLALVRGDSVEAEVPAEAAWAPGARVPRLLIELRWEDVPGDLSPVAHVRVRLRRLLTALHLFEAAGFAIGPVGWLRGGGQGWEPFAPALGGVGRGDALEVGPDGEDELRAFCSLVTRRAPRDGELGWALRRFELSCERPLAAEGLTDAVLALRALLEPEGDASARLPGRLAALCALAQDRAELARRTAQALEAERAVRGGRAAGPELDQLAGELGGHLRALLRDVLCGHLDGDLCALADGLIAESAAAQHTAGTHTDADAGNDAEAEQPTLA